MSEYDSASPSHHHRGGGRRGGVVGTKEEVFNRLADKTPGGLTRSKLTKNKDGKVVSKAQRAAGLRLQRKYPVKKTPKKTPAKSRR